MPWCPKCRYEYLPEISNCPECGTELLDQEPVSLYLARKPLFRIKPNIVYLICFTMVGFNAHALFTGLIAGFHSTMAERMTIAMLAVSLIGLSMGLMLPFVTTARVFIGSLLGGVAWFALFTTLSMSADKTGSAMLTIRDFVGTAIFSFLISATLTVVSVSAHRCNKNHSLRHAVELVLLIVILTGAPLALKYLFDTLVP